MANSRSLVHGLTGVKDDGEEFPRSDWMQAIHNNSTYTTPQNKAWQKQLNDLQGKKRKARVEFEEKKRVESEEQAESRSQKKQKMVVMSRTTETDKFYSFYQPNVTEEPDDDGSRPTTDFTNPTSSAFDLYDEKGDPSTSTSSSNKVNKIKLKQSFDISSFIMNRKMSETIPAGGFNTGHLSSFETRVRTEHEMRQLMVNHASRDKVGDIKIADALALIRTDALYFRVLDIDLRDLIQNAERYKGVRLPSRAKLEAVPNRFRDASHYKAIYIPLLLEEMSASLVQHIAEGVSQRKKRHLEESVTEVVVLKAAHYESDTVKVEVKVFLNGIKADKLVLHKEDLVVLFPLGLSQTSASWPHNHKSSNVTLNKLLCGAHCLAIVTSSTQNIQFSGSRLRDTSHRNYEASSHFTHTLLLPLRKLDRKLPAVTSKWLVKRITSLTTSCREHVAVHSLGIPELVPLAPYILKASPVVSTRTMSEVKEHLVLLIGNLERILQEFSHLPTEDNKLRVDKVSAAVRVQLKNIASFPVDGSVLQQSGVGKVLNNSLINNRKLMKLPELVRRAKALKERWKEQVKRDLNDATLSNLKGGCVVVIPQRVKEEAEALYRSSSSAKPHDTLEQSKYTTLNTFLKAPHGCTPALWRELRNKFNVSQLYSIKHVCDKLDADGDRAGLDTRIALLQGPPGTGKTSTIIGMVSLFLSKHVHATSTSSSLPSNIEVVKKKKKKSRILLCAPSNAAVDELLLRIIRDGVLDANGQLRGLNIVRLGGSEDPEVGALNLETQVEEKLQSHEIMRDHLMTKERTNQLESKLGELEARLKRCSVNINVLKTSDSGDKSFLSPEQEAAHVQAELSQLSNKRLMEERDLEFLRSYFREDLIRNSDLIAGTCSGAGHSGFVDLLLKEEISFEVCIIDEASQCSEPSTLVPLRYGCVNLVLVGDPRQLPPTIISPLAEEAGLGTSLFDRLERCGHEVVMLNIQYRMHPDLRIFPSQQFYGSQLEDSWSIQKEVAAVASKSVMRGLKKEEGEGGEEDVTTSLSFCFFGRTGKIYVNDPDYLSDPLEVSALNFYNLQSSYEESRGSSFINLPEARFSIFLAKALNRKFRGKKSIAIITPYKAQRALVQSLLSDELLPKVEINTIDGFQGREKDCVVFCCVRDGRSGGIGFLSDERRMNVAITRARGMLAIIGHSSGVGARDSTWRALVQSVSERGRLIDVKTKEYF